MSLLYRFLIGTKCIRGVLKKVQKCFKFIKSYNLAIATLEHFPVNNTHISFFLPWLLVWRQWWGMSRAEGAGSACWCPCHPADSWQWSAGIAAEDWRPCAPPWPHTMRAQKPSAGGNPCDPSRWRWWDAAWRAKGYNFKRFCAKDLYPRWLHNKWLHEFSRNHSKSSINFEVPTTAHRRRMWTSQIIKNSHWCLISAFYSLKALHTRNRLPNSVPR